MPGARCNAAGLKWRSIMTLVNENAENGKNHEATCEHCRKAFEPRRHSGGKPQRFCSPACRFAFHQRGERGQCDQRGDDAPIGNLPIAGATLAANAETETAIAALAANHSTEAARETRAAEADEELIE